MEIALVGAGAIGTAVAASLWEAGRRDQLFCVRASSPSHEWAVDGPGGRVVFEPQTARDPRAASHARFVLLATKAHQTESAAEWMAALVGSETMVVVLQNGIDHEEHVAPYALGRPIVPVVVSTSAERIAENHVVVRGPIELTLRDDPAARAFAALFEGSTAHVHVLDAKAFARAAWEKLCVNAIGGISALTGVPLDLRDAELDALARGMLQEIRMVAGAEGVVLDDAFLDRLVLRYRDTPASRPNSILADRLAGRPLEWAARNAIVVARAQRHGIRVPLNADVTDRLRATSERASHRTTHSR